jgi:glycosyltransferase involved in cell wall biosynthesis
MTRLAVLIPVYRNASGLHRTLESLKQAEGSFDVVVVDDGSPEPIAAPTRLRPDVGVSLLRLEKNRGIAAALNYGLRRILQHEYSCIGRLDAGDTVVADRFERQISFLDTNPGCAAVSSFVDFVDATETLVFRFCPPCDHEGILQRLHLNNCLVHSGTTMRVGVLRELGVYREDVPGAEDYELFLRMSRRYTLAVLPEVLTHCEYSLTGLTVTGRRRQQQERLKLQLRYFTCASRHSFYGVARTLLAMVVPHETVLRIKRAHSRGQEAV